MFLCELSLRCKLTVWKNSCLVQGRPFEVKEMFLEDILRTTGYTNKEMLKYKKEKQRGKLFIKQI